MSTPVNKNNQTPPPTTNEPYSKNYGDPYGGDYGGGGYDPGMGEGQGGTGDVSTDSYENGDYGDYGDFGDFMGGEEDFGVEGGDETGEGAGAGAGGPITEEAVRAMLRDLQGTMSESDYKAFQGRINATTGMSPERAAQELSAIAEELNMIANPQGSVDEMSGEDGEAPVDNEEHAKAVDDFKDDLEDYRDDIMSMENLTEEEKTTFAAQVDTMINEIELAEKDPAKLAEIDVESLKADLDEIKGQVDAGNLHSQGVKGLADLAGMTPEELAAKAEAAGIDLSNLSLPPPMQLFDFLKEISPELKSKLEAVETAMNERAKFYETNKQAADSQNSSNSRSSTDTDNTDTTPWQNLYNLKYHQDEKSKAVMDAMKSVMDTMSPLLEALYPGQDVKPVESSGLSGWEKTHADYAIADQISIGGTVIDLFNDVDGKIQPTSTLTETEVAIEIPKIAADGEGDGEWHPPSLQTYGESQVGNDWYKDGG
jgi:hypothetical protein